MAKAEEGPDGSVELDAFIEELAEAEAYAPIAETERAADQWLAAALLKLAGDPALVEHVRKKIEDALVEWRDEGRFVSSHNGLAIYNRDGTGPHVIRISTAMAVGMILREVADHLRGDM